MVGDEVGCVAGGTDSSVACVRDGIAEFGIVDDGETDGGRGLDGGTANVDGCVCSGGVRMSWNSRLTARVGVTWRCTRFIS